MRTAAEARQTSAQRLLRDELAPLLRGGETAAQRAVRWWRDLHLAGLRDMEEELRGDIRRLEEELSRAKPRSQRFRYLLDQRTRKMDRLAKILDRIKNHQDA